MQKQYNQQLDQQKPVIEFENIFMNTPPVPIVGGAYGLLPTNISITIHNTRKEKLSHAEYVYAIWDGKEVAMIDYRKDNVSYSHLDYHILNLQLGTIPDAKRVSINTMILFLFLYVEDSSWRSTYTVFAQQILPGNEIRPHKTDLVIPPNTDFNSLDNIKERIWEHVMLNVTQEKQLLMAGVLNADLDFREYRKDPRFKDFLPDIWRIADNADN